MYARLRSGDHQVATKHHGYIKLVPGQPHPSWQPEVLNNKQYNTIIMVRDSGVYLVQSIDFNFDVDFVPACPNCEYVLESVKVEEWSTWVVDREGGRYIEDRPSSYLNSVCPRCGYILTKEVFPEGPANY